MLLLSLFLARSLLLVGFPYCSLLATLFLFSLALGILQIDQPTNIGEDPTSCNTLTVRANLALVSPPLILVEIHHARAACRFRSSPHIPFPFCDPPHAPPADPCCVYCMACCGLYGNCSELVVDSIMYSSSFRILVRLVSR